MRRHAGSVSRHTVGARRESTFQDRLRVIVVADPDKHADLLTRQTFWILAGIFDRLPAGFQQQTMLGVDPLGFGRRDPEQRCIELVDIGQPAGTRGGHGIGNRHGAIRWRFGDGMLARADPFPKRGRRVASRQAARHADNGDSVGIDILRLDIQGIGRYGRQRRWRFFTHYQASDFGDVGCVIKQRGRKRTSGMLFQFTGDHDRTDAVETELGKRRLDVDAFQRAPDLLGDPLG